MFFELYYLCDDSRSDLYGLDGRCLSDQRHRSLHSNRVACWFSCVGGDSCRENGEESFDFKDILKKKRKGKREIRLYTSYLEWLGDTE